MFVIKGTLTNKHENNLIDIQLLIKFLKAINIIQVNFIFWMPIDMEVVYSQMSLQLIY